ncbi:GNAT family N-acetyltransferase [Citricoccus muralis]|uniref:GNAT family N-acetyltransferase n=1 Tax=Citricoccus muralis TaxID=169134 RepID=A0ABY8H7V0_9MICC|nr:GNAT family N-acetyltransferase [Citricoccus muralis]WFP17224.1 GNAT family N-acetyltransferase [Citricoccus muralis]
MSEPMTVQRAHWYDLDARTAYEIARLRYRVFTMGQGVTTVEDLDGRDLESGSETWWIAVDGTPVATLRVLREAVGISIGRVATDGQHRGHGYASELITAAMDAHRGERVEIHAQAHLEAWYAGFGTYRVGEEYLDAEIPHVTMIKDAPSALTGGAMGADAERA